MTSTIQLDVKKFVGVALAVLLSAIVLHTCSGNEWGGESEGGHPLHRPDDK